ncbi:MAG: four helix bundle protein [Candidatus Omnitrophica bacterium]|nr:four helix bundle protein [Candidatus Omnitrophota bacterium]MDD5441046.1 four helix bundle protein [Candidatus Omnitrophota bacterium]
MTESKEIQILNTKSETLNKQNTKLKMKKIQDSKPYNFGERTKKFAKRVRDYIKAIPKTLSNIEYAKQVIRSSGSVGANYIEAEESLSKKDFIMRIKISRKEAKESKYWIELIEPIQDYIKEKEFLMKEATELTKIFGAIVENSK